MKPLALAITAATMALASTASAAPASGFTTLSWGDSPKRVAALNTGYKMQYKFSDNLTYQGSPKSDLFMKLRTAAPYRYVFFKNGLYSVHMDLALFDSRQAHSQLNALLKYNTIKDEMVKQFGKPTSVVEHYTEGKPFFALYPSASSMSNHTPRQGFRPARNLRQASASCRACASLSA